MVRAVPKYFVTAFHLVVNVVHSSWVRTCYFSQVNFSLLTRHKRRHFRWVLMPKRVTSQSTISLLLYAINFYNARRLSFYLCQAGCSFYIRTLSRFTRIFFSYLDRIWSDRSSSVLSFEEWPTMQSLAHYSLGSGDNVVSLLRIALQLKWLTMRAMSHTIAFMSIAAHTNHVVWRCFGAHFGLTCLLHYWCGFFLVL